MDEQSYQLVYNSDPNLAALDATGNLQEVSSSFARDVLITDGQDVIQRFRDMLNALVAGGERRRTIEIQIRSAMTGRPCPMRPQRCGLAGDGLLHRRFIFLCVPLQKSSEQPPVNEVDTELAGIYRYRNDRWFTLESYRGLPWLLGYSEEELQEQFHGRLMELVEPSERMPCARR